MVAMMAFTLPLAGGFLVGFVVGGVAVGQHYYRSTIGKAQTKQLERVYGTELLRTLGKYLPTFGALICELSPSFCDIYQQASLAENYGLKDVCGIGYGKSLEFLIKDFAKIESPEVHTAIEMAPLGKCIREFIKAPAIRDSAELATWLRNDETHYVRKFESRDTSHLKQLIDLTVKQIEIELNQTVLRDEVERIRKAMLEEQQSK